MAHLTGFGVENFRVFRDETWFDFAPLTILVGPNNSGKSSLAKALMLFSNGDEGLIKGRIGQKLNNLDLQKIKSNKTNSETITFRFQIEGGNWDWFPSEWFNAFFLREEKINITLSYENSKLIFLSVYSDKKQLFVIGIIDDVIHYYINLKEIFTNIKFIKENYHLKGKKWDNLIYISQNLYAILNKYSINTISESFTKVITPSESKIIEELIINYLSHPFGAYYSKQIFDSMYNDPNFDFSEVDFSEFFKTCFISAVEPDINKINRFLYNYNEEIKKYVPRKLEEIFDLADMNKSGVFSKSFKKKIDAAFKLKFKDYFLKDIISPEFFDTFENLVGKGFMSIFDKMRFWEFEHIPIVRGVNNVQINKESLIIKYRNCFRKVTPDIADISTRSDFVHKWLRKFGIEKLEITDYKEEVYECAVTIDSQNYSLSELGFGYSQLLPLLLSSSILGIKGTGVIELVPTILNIEEPESNLHPKYQSLLADYFIDLIQSFKTQLIIETHSEYIIRKLQYLTAKKGISPKDTVIYYFHNPDQVPEGEKQVKKINILEDGSLSDNFGPGFFDEALNLKLDLLRLKNQQN